ncbi:PQQ-like beta-propeller repeat protein, partial [bacterium]|nr:PQQ-like beta-propeller repeat protein [bacterium]
NVVYFGDCSGIIHALDITNGKEIWKCETKGVQIPAGESPFDRKAIFAAVAIQGNVCIVGSRDGFFYGINKADGQIMWSNDYSMSWVLSSAAVKDSLAIAGTSDGRFVNAVNVTTGKEIWRFQTRNIVWASPIIVGNLVYVPSCDGILHILDSRTGKKISEYRTVNSLSIFSSPVFTDSTVVIATDEGAVISLKGRQCADREERSGKKYVLWTDVVPAYFRNGMDVRIRDYFVDNGYQVIDTLGVIRIMTSPVEARESTTIVIASPVIPDTLISAEGTSIFRQYLDHGGKVILLGFNPLLFSPKQILDIEYGPPDTRAYKGLFPAFPTAIGTKYHLPAFWSAFASVNINQVDTVLGMDENGQASAWIKYYGKEKKGGLIQVWLEQTRPVDYNFLKTLSDIN